ncbi:MAG: DUF4304 domain-containing protein [Clostridiaceae bacterium]|nr:DUF4304 domain-containing protein [Clostridiaceae bacterium]
MKAAEFKKLMKNYFAPTLRKYGFKGSGFNYIKATENHYIYTVQIQSDKYGEGCWIELGVTTDFLPDTLGYTINPKKVSPLDCEFRKRLDPTINDSMWLFGETEDKAKQSIVEMAHEFEQTGLVYFKQFVDFPSPLSLITIEDIINESPVLKHLESPLDLRLAMTVARVHTFLGNKRDAIKFCDWGLNNIGRATGLISVFEEIKQHNIA